MRKRMREEDVEEIEPSGKEGRKVADTSGQSMSSFQVARMLQIGLFPSKLLGNHSRATHFAHRDEKTQRREQLRYH